MKRFTYVIVGSLVLGFLAFLGGAGISQYQVRVLMYSPDKAGEFIDIFLLIWPLTFAIGGWLGWRLSRPKS
jgi:hypothetical protein